MITIFTSVYNRDYSLLRLYRSLQKQTYNNFEWLIIDDGSTDNTEKLVKQWQKNQSNFPIRYIKQENAGKHTAINKGVKEAKGEIFFIVDSDDCLPFNAIGIIEREFKKIYNDENFAGLGGLKADIKTQIPLCNGSKMKCIDSSMIDIRQKHNIKGDM